MQPVRHAAYPAHPTLRDERILTETVEPSATTYADAVAAWQSYLGRDVPVLLVKNVDYARKLLMRAFGVEEGERVGVPANCRRALSESVKKTNRNVPHFVELDGELEFVAETPGVEQLRLIWAEPVGGMAPPEPLPGTSLLIDNGFSLPVPPFAPNQELRGAATLWGLHLSETLSEAGALIAFSDRQLYDAARELISEDEDGPDLDRAMAQYRRLVGPDGLAARQLAVYLVAREGMEIAAGVPITPLDGVCALPFGLAVRVPEEADVSTFLSYGRNELVPVWWLPEIQPVFYVAYQTTQDRELTRRTAAHLDRWLISPLGPDFLEEEIVHAVLVIVKAAEYTGVRWYTDPARASWYNDLMLEWYGPTHDAYRMAFVVEAEAVAADG